MGWFTPLRRAVLWAALGVAALVFGVWGSRWSFNQGMFRFLGILMLMYAAVHVLLYYYSRRRSTLSAEEIEEHGAALEAATPQIVELLRAGQRATAVVRVIARAHGLPRSVVRRYLSAVVQELAMLLASQAAGDGKDEAPTP